MTRAARNTAGKGRSAALFSRLKSAFKAAKERREQPKKRMKFTLCGGFWVWLGVLAFALIFTQALRSPISGVLLTAVMLLPLLCLLYLVFAGVSLHAVIDSHTSEIPKETPMKFGIRLDNDGLLPLPLCECDMLLPDPHGVRSTLRRVGFSLAPAGQYRVVRTVTFSYRGQYMIGVPNLYVCDFLRLFRLRLDPELYAPVFVLPRRLTMLDAVLQPPSDMTTESSTAVRGADRSEVADVRGYRAGDHLKTIHWPLSSKTQELVVKEYAMNSGRTAYIFADLARAYPADETMEDDICEYAADGIVETAIAAASHELQAGAAVTLIWYDPRTENGTQQLSMQTPADLTHNFEIFATAPLAPADKAVTDLALLAEETQAAAMLFVTARLDKALCDGLTGAAAAFGSVSGRGALRLLYADPSPRVKEPYRAAFRDNCDRLARQVQSIGVAFDRPRMM